MVKKLVLFLTLLVTYEFIVMQTEAAGRTCLAKSKKHSGICFSMRNCKRICKRSEGFLGGQCKRGVCMCAGKCGNVRPYAPSFPTPSDGGVGSNPSGGIENNPGEGNDPGGDDRNIPIDGDVGNNPSDGNNTGGGDVGNNNPGGGQVGTRSRTCRARSKKFSGYCYLNSRSVNCKRICKRSEGFTGGSCSRGSCICTAKCGGRHNVVLTEKNTSEFEEIDGQSNNVGDVKF